MKKMYILSLSLIITSSLLMACGDKKEVEVTAMENNIVIETETNSETETTTEIETETETETETESESIEIKLENESGTDGNGSVDSTGVNGEFEEGEERGGAPDNLGVADNDNTDKTGETSSSEQTSKNKIRDAGFTVDDFEYDPSKSDLFEDGEEEMMKELLQSCIDAYEAGEYDYYTLMGVLADLGIDNTKLLEEYEKKHQSSSTSNVTASQQETTYNPEDYGLTPEGPGRVIEPQPLHPEWSDTVVW